MTNKKSIIHLLDIEIMKLITPYEEKIERLENEIVNLEKKLLENTNKIKRDKAESNKGSHKLSNEVLLDHIQLLGEAVSYEIIDDLLMSHNIEDITLLLLHCKNFVKETDINKVRYILDSLIKDPHLLLLGDKSLIYLLIEVFNEIVSVNNNIDIYDEMLISFIALLLELYATTLQGTILIYLQRSYSVLLPIVSKTNNPEVIIPYLQLLLQYNIKIELRAAMKHIIEVEWEYLDINLSDNEFSFFLWFSFLYNLDEKLLRISSNGFNRFEKSYGENTLYHFIFESIEKKEVTNQAKLQHLIGTLNKNELFNEKCIAEIINKVLATLKPFMNNKLVTSFQWPTTELKENKDNNNNPSDLHVINENSQLKLLGYQITGLTRTDRWIILEKAVPKLSLKTVAYIISFNLKLRKGQMNGPVKYRYAIEEWEHDLKKLKKTYYKRDFNWPKS